MEAAARAFPTVTPKQRPGVGERCSKRPDVLSRALSRSAAAECVTRITPTRASEGLSSSTPRRRARSSSLGRAGCCSPRSPRGYVDHVLQISSARAPTRAERAMARSAVIEAASAAGFAVRPRHGEGWAWQPPREAAAVQSRDARQRARRRVGPRALRPGDVLIAAQEQQQLHWSSPASVSGRARKQRSFDETHHG